jgi:hypothetical protein
LFNPAALWLILLQASFATSRFAFGYAGQFGNTAELSERKFRPKGEVHGWTESQDARHVAGERNSGLIPLKRVEDPVDFLAGLKE